MCDQCQPRPEQVFPIITTDGVLTGAMTFYPSACRADCRCAVCRPDIHVTAGPIVTFWLNTTAGPI